MRSRALLAVTLSIALTATAQAEDQGRPVDEAPRNPVNWLLSDIGKLFEPLATGADKGASQAVTAADAETAPMAATAEQTPSIANVSGKASITQSVENPFGAIFRDLAALFAPSEPAATQPATVVETKQAEAITVTPTKPVDETAPSVTANARKNPLAHLFNDIAAIFDGSGAVTTPDHGVAVADTSAPQSNTDLTAAPTAVAESTPATLPTAKKSNPVAYLLSDITNLFATPATPMAPANPPTESAAATEATSAETAPAPVDATPGPTAIEARQPVDALEQPWRLPENGRIFDPAHPLFAASAMPHTSAPTVAVATEEATSREAAVAAEAASLRLRAEPKPERRNYQSLGREQVAANTESEDSIFGNFLRNLFLVEDEPARAPAAAEVAEASNPAPMQTETEPLANTISDRIVPEEHLDLGYAAPDAPIQETSIERIGDGPLRDIDLFVGRDIAIGGAYDAAIFGANDCVERPLHASVFCLTQFHWPPEIAASFTEDTAFTLPGEGVVRYENGRVSRVYTIFKASRFADVVKFMQHRFGPPSEREIVWMPVMEAPRLPNTTFRWSAITADRRDKIILEVRNYDDQRRSFADLEHGMVRLYRDGSRPIFKHLSTMDLMLLQRRRIAQAPATPTAPAAQN